MQMQRKAPFSVSAYLLSLLVNEKRSFRLQISISFVLLSLLGMGSTLTLCYVLMFNLIDETLAKTSGILIDDAKTNALSIATAMSSTLNNQLQILANTICLSSAFYASILVSNAVNISDSSDPNRLMPMPLHREYKFASGCGSECPADFGAFPPSVRYPSAKPALASGSLTSSSIYLYEGKSQTAIRSDSAWNAIVPSNVPLTGVLNATVYQDLDYSVLYNRGSNATLMITMTALIANPAEPAAYYVAHRVFPGIALASPGTSKDPSVEAWFVNAPVNATYFRGPYLDPVTDRLVFSLSSKQITTLPSAIPATFVSTAVVLVDEIEATVRKVKFTEGGFGAVINAATAEVLVWEGKDFRALGHIPSLAEVDASLGALFPLADGSVTEYTDSQGEDWILSVASFFPSKSLGASSASKSLSLLVFTKRSEALSTFDLLHEKTTATATTVIISTIVIIFVFVIVALIMILILVTRMTLPLKAMSDLSHDVLVQYMDFKQEDRNFQAIVDAAEKTGYQCRKDEIGILFSNYHAILNILQQDHMYKMNTPKYPSNPFYHTGETSWTALMSSLAESLPDLPPARSPKRMEPTVISVRADDAPRGKMFSPFKYLYKPIRIAEAGESTNVVDRSEHKGNVASTVFLKSLRFNLIAMGLLLLLGLVAAMVYTLLALTANSEEWITSVADSLKQQQIQTVNNIGTSQALYVQTFYGQLALDVFVGASFVQQLILERLPRTGFYDNPLYYRRSYSRDEFNNFTAPTTPSFAYSGYWGLGDAKCELTADACRTTYNARQTRLTSLIDVKLRSFFYSNASLATVVLGMQDSGFFRVYPYVRNRNYARPTTCHVESRTTEYCNQRWLNSKCNPDNPSLALPTYDPRCRGWYGQSIDVSPSLATFTKPYVASGGSLLITPTVSLRDGSDTLLGIFGIDYGVIKLSQQINSIRLLQSGYGYLLDSASPNSTMLHPKNSLTCKEVLCAENFTATEYANFYTDVLKPLSDGTFASGYSTTYVKNGSEWLLVYNPVLGSTFKYAIFSTVPLTEILAGSLLVRDAIEVVLKKMTRTFPIVIAAFLVFFIVLINMLVQTILNPVYDLQKLLMKLKSRDTSGVVPKVASSSDMVDILRAFSNLVVSIRLSDHSSSLDNLEEIQIFTDAHDMFARVQNTKGMGVSANNLSMVELKSGSYHDAEVHMVEALHIAESAPVSTVDTRQLLSDRKGNLAVVYLEKRNFPSALKILKESLAQDHAEGNVKGCLVKQCNLGLYYLQNRDIASADKIIQATLALLMQALSDDDGRWDKFHAVGYEQLVLYITAYLMQVENVRPLDEIQTAYLRALSVPKLMVPSIANRILNTLFVSFRSNRAGDKADELKKVIAELKTKLYAFEIDKTFASFKDSSTIMFLVNYSRDMCGFKIKQAKSYLEFIYSRLISKNDYVGITTFNATCEIVRRISKKDVSGNASRKQFTETSESTISDICGLLHPELDCCLLDAICSTSELLSEFYDRQSVKSYETTILLLTDGCESDISSVKLEQACAILRRSRVKLIVVWVGDEVEDVLPRAGALDSLVNSSRRGLLVDGSSRVAAEGILNKAFSHISSTMSEGVLLIEEF